jgi:hypothetical protein
MKKTILLAGMLFLMTSCGRLDFGIKIFSFYVRSEVDDMFDLNTPQKELFSRNFSSQMEKIKRQQFPIYADYLERLADLYQNGTVTGEKTSHFFDEGIQLFFSAPPQWHETVEAIVMTLTPQQLKNFEEYFQDRLQEQSEKIESPKDRFKKQFKSMNKWIDETIEDLSSSQEDRLEQYVRLNPSPDELAVRSQQHVFNQFKDSFSDPEKRKQFIHTFVNDWKSLQLPDYVKARELYVEKLKDYVIDLSLNLNEKQKRNLIENLQKRAAELRRLAQKSN